jgi:Cu/Ag efflux protein CusF
MTGDPVSPPHDGGRKETNAMNRFQTTVLSLGLSLALGGAALAQDSKPPKPIKVSEKVTIKATVEAIDKTNREVTLKGPKGNLLTMPVDESVQRFDQIKVGDVITAKYYESVVVQLAKPGAVPTSDATMGGVAALPGAKPGAAGATQTTTSVTIEAIDPETPAVTVRTSDGSELSFRVKNKKFLKDLKVGDQVTITQTQGLMIEVGDSK